MKRSIANKIKILIIICLVVTSSVTIYLHTYNKNIIKAISTDIKINNSNNSSQGVQIREAEYTEEYKKWLELSEEERKNYIEPNHYGVSYYTRENENKFTSLLERARIQTARIAPTRYDLRNKVNLTVKNQMDTASCWAFSTTTMLESNIELKTRKSIGTLFSKTYGIYNIKNIFRWNK